MAEFNLVAPPLLQFASALQGVNVPPGFAGTVPQPGYVRQHGTNFAPPALAVGLKLDGINYNAVRLDFAPNVTTLDIPAWYVTAGVNTYSIAQMMGGANISVVILYLGATIVGGAPTLHFTANDPNVFKADGGTVNAGAVGIILI